MGDPKQNSEQTENSGNDNNQMQDSTPPPPPPPRSRETFADQPEPDME